MSVKSGKLSRFSLVAQTIPLTRKSLAELRLKAVRRGVWFRDLKHCERKLLDLTINVVEKIHSYLLAKLISKIVDKLCVSMESKIVRLIRTEGRAMAKRFSQIGSALGCISARTWAVDHKFMQFLVITNLQVLTK